MFDPKVHWGSEIFDIEPPEWLIDEIIVRGGQTIVFGESGAGKSFFVLDMANCIARGRSLFGRYPVRHPERVLYMAGEGVAGFPLRQRAWLTHHKETDSENIGLVGDIVPLNIGTESEQVKWLIDTAIDMEATVIVWDTLSRAIPGSDENNQKDMSSAVDTLTFVQKRVEEALGRKVSVILVHHIPKGGDAKTGPRGSTVLTGAVESIIRVHLRNPGSGRDPVTGTYTMDIEVTCYKQKDGHPFDPMVLKSVEYEIDPREKLTSVALDLQHVGAKAAKISVEEELMKLLLVDEYEGKLAQKTEYTSNRGLGQKKKVIEAFAWLEMHGHVILKHREPVEITESGREKYGHLVTDFKVTGTSSSTETRPLEEL